jgi:hypothetical protein
MQRLNLSGVLLVGVCLVGCAERPTKEGFFTKEAECFKCYCASNPLAAEAALLELDRYARRCQRSGVEGIQYEGVFLHIYGRLYLLERHLGREEAAELYLEKYAHFHGLSSSLARRIGRPHGEMEGLIEHKVDEGLKVAWKAP